MIKLPTNEMIPMTKIKQLPEPSKRTNFLIEGREEKKNYQIDITGY